MKSWLSPPAFFSCPARISLFDIPTARPPEEGLQAPLPLGWNYMACALWKGKPIGRIFHVDGKPSAYTKWAQAAFSTAGTASMVITPNIYWLQNRDSFSGPYLCSKVEPLQSDLSLWSGSYHPQEVSAASFYRQSTDVNQALGGDCGTLFAAFGGKYA